MDQFEIPIVLKQLITSNQAFHYRIIPFEKDDSTVAFKTDTKNLKKLQDELGVVLNYNSKLVPDSKENIDSYLTYNYRQSTSQNEDLSTADFLEQLLKTARGFNSSDIHLEPYEKHCRVRYRLDGKLKEQYRIPLAEYPQLINQIKIQAGLDISQKRMSQDGRITV
ncbi:ATPase, T2SS/T4P/T4SS family, partial [uncultured Planktosalinus sp.]|uniref:ATPase, T2SS/T4P/T4SS family n=1 Tax=uncultured Planktosalinus sp. TaxID=1810935 RepID=UPI0030D76CB1